MTLLLKSNRKKHTSHNGIFVGLKGKGKSSQKTNLRAIVEHERNALMDVETKLNATNNAILALQFMLQMIQEGCEEIHLNPNPLVPNSLYEIEEMILLQNGFQPVGAPEHHWWKKYPAGMKVFNGNIENIYEIMKEVSDLNCAIKE